MDNCSSAAHKTTRTRTICLDSLADMMMDSWRKEDTYDLLVLYKERQELDGFARVCCGSCFGESYVPGAMPEQRHFKKQHVM